MADHPLLRVITDRLGVLVDDCLPADGDQGVIVGLSGGPDSVALLLSAVAWGGKSGRTVAAAHLDHRLRGNDSTGDLDFCRELCKALGTTLFEQAEDPRPVARTRGLGLEEAGRHLRRRFFADLLNKHPEYGCVATGHHRDDQVETVVMRLFRGTGPEGLRGIRPVAAPFIHPMLEVDRAEIVACLEQIGQPWRTDATNLEGDNLRARIRRELWPVIRGIFGLGAEKGPARLAGLLERDLALLEKLGAEALADTISNDDPETLDVDRLKGLDPALATRVLRSWLEPVQPEGLERVHVDGVLTWLAGGQSGTSRDLPGGTTLRWDLDRLRRETGDSDAPPLRAAADYRIVVAKGGDSRAVGEPADDRSWRLTCPARALSGNLQVRNWREGDRFQPFGLDGTKKLSDLLREKRLPAGDRPGVLVVSDDAGILWVVGLARAERTRLLPTTTHTVTISVARRSDQRTDDTS